MPPKRKKVAVSPIVVGTVSTRSTRRQSVVNIEIPKSKSMKASPKVLKEESSDIFKSDTGPTDLTEKIKESYNNMMNKSMFSKSTIENLDTRSFITDKSPTKAQTSKSSTAKVSKYLLSKGSIAQSKEKGKVKSNKALLQILEDWTDDESQDVKKNKSDPESSDDTEDNQEYDTLKIKQEDENKCDEDDNDILLNIVHSLKEDSKSDSVPTIKIESAANISNNSPAQTPMEVIVDQMEGEDLEIITVPKSNSEDIVMETEELPMQVGHEDTSEVIEEFIVDENQTVVIEEPVAFDEDEVIVECVSEEVECVSEECNNQHFVVDVAEGQTPSSSQDDYGTEELKETPENVTCKTDIGTIAQSLNKDNNINKEDQETVTENVILEETNQSISTSDSNDAEVQGFFSKEIENNEIVKDENIVDVEYEVVEEQELTNSSKENADSLTSTFEENIVETEIVPAVENIAVISEKNISESNFEKFVEAQQEMTKLIETDREFQSSDESFQQEASALEIVRTNNSSNMMDIVESEDSIESKIAQLHLKDAKTKEINEISEKENKLDDIVMAEENDTKMENETEKEHSNKLELIPEKPKIRRTRSNEVKSTKTNSEIQEHTKESRSPKLTKSGKSNKEKKSLKQRELKPNDTKLTKDSKNRKKVNTTSLGTKGKEKSEKKDTGSNYKKELVKKFTKTDSDQIKKQTKSDNTDSEDTEVRRSSRIKSISVLKKRTKGHGLVRSKSEPILNESDVSDSNSTQNESEKSTPSASPKVLGKEKKSRWTRSSENLSSDSQSTMELTISKSDGHLSEATNMDIDEKPKLPLRDPVVKARLKQFVHLKENLYKTDRMTCKEAKKMTCDCFLTPEEILKSVLGCGDDCLNRLLLIECGNLCQVGERCTNKRFQKGQFAPVEVFNTEKKGLGLRAAANIPYGDFILEYVGEVLNCEEFDKRAAVYSQDKNIHYYFMSLRADAIIDATMKGNISRFINHSCDPNAETQKWTVNGELRIGFFSTRTILAGEEITFDYRFQRYGKEAQKCYCEAAICRGWLGEQPDEDSEDEDEEEEEEEEEVEDRLAAVKIEDTVTDDLKKIEDDLKPAETAVVKKIEDIKVEMVPQNELPSSTPVAVKRKSPRKKPRKDIFEDLDQLDEEIGMLVTTGLKNQAHTLKLSRLMVRAKEPAQRTKLLRILRRGELPCRRLFLDYHGLRLMHGYMIDAQHLVHTDKKYESLRLEMLQTLAVLPIPNKTMLQDSKVLPTVEKWSTNKDLSSPLDSDSNSPKNEQDLSNPPANEISKEIDKEPPKTDGIKKEEDKPERSIEDQEEEIRFLAMKLLEGWTNLKEVYRIPKKERIEQMKEHEREANKKFMQSGYGGESDSSRKSDRYRNWSRYKFDRDINKKGSKFGDKPSAEFIRLSKIERRKLFALQHELKEEERRLKQREMWRQHEVNCMLIGTDPRFTAPFDPSRGFQCIWNPQIGQWQNYPIPPQTQPIYSPQPPTPSNINLPLPNLNVPPPQIQIPKSIPNFPFTPQIAISTSINGGMTQIPASICMTGQVQPPSATGMSQLHLEQQLPNLPPNFPTINSMQGIPGALPQNIPTHPQIPVSVGNPQLPQIVQYQEPIQTEEDFSKVKFMGPIPPPVKLPPKWKSAKDQYGRPYYYHVTLRISQWEPPPILQRTEDPEESSESESSSDTSSVSSDTSSENSESDDEIDDTRLLIEVRKQMEKSAKLTLKPNLPEPIIKTEENLTPSPEEKNSEEDFENDEDMSVTASFIDDDIDRPSIDIRLKEQFDLLKDDKPPKKKRRLGLCEEIIISPRSEEDRLQFKEDLKRYKANKEKLKRQKEVILQQTKKQLRESEPKKIKEKRGKPTLKNRIKEMSDFNSEAAKKIKENFRSNMASTVVGALNVYRKPDCKEGKITNTEDFKHLARKLTHFVMLKEMKHIAKIEDLTCTDNVKSKAREYIKKYMSKFGEVYIKRNDSPDFKD